MRFDQNHMSTLRNPNLGSRNTVISPVHTLRFGFLNQENMNLVENANLGLTFVQIVENTEQQC
jgi:hypothetical protein